MSEPLVLVCSILVSASPGFSAVGLWAFSTRNRFLSSLSSQSSCNCFLSSLSCLQNDRNSQCSQITSDPRDAESPSRTGITREDACVTQPDSPPCELLIRSPPVPRMVPRLSAINLLSCPNINFRSKGSMHRALIRDFH